MIATSTPLSQWQSAIEQQQSRTTMADQPRASIPDAPADATGNAPSSAMPAIQDNLAI
jgi:hypothetical protein